MNSTSAFKDADTLSTVTDLISACKCRQKISTRSLKQERQKTSSGRLERYIKNYEKNQTRNLAEILTRHVPVLPPLPEGNKENEIRKEIILARSLFGDTAAQTPTDGVQSLSTEDLLTMDPQSVAGFHRNHYSVLPTSSSMSMKPVLYSTPNKGSNSKSDTTAMKPSPMRFSEIATTLRSEFDDVFGTDTTTTDLTESQSNTCIYTLNGSTYTPHKEKYKSILMESDDARRSAVSPEAIYSDTYDINSTPSKTLTTDAGRTPYRSHTRKIYMTESSENDLETSFQSSASQSHYSVPFEFKGCDEIIDFMKDCLGSDSDITTEISKESGAVETLKNMLFKLQSVALEENDDTDNISTTTESSLKDGHSSLKLAISHLSNLQHLLT